MRRRSVSQTLRTVGAGKEDMGQHRPRMLPGVCREVEPSAVCSMRMEKTMLALVARQGCTAV